MAHTGADADTALVGEIATTPANVHDGKTGANALPEDPGEVVADSADRGPLFNGAVRAEGGTPRIVATGMWGADEAETLKRLAKIYSRTGPINSSKRADALSAITRGRGGRPPARSGQLDRKPWSVAPNILRRDATSIDTTGNVSIGIRPGDARPKGIRSSGR